LYTPAEKHQVAVRFLEIVIRDVIARLEESAMKNTTRIYDFVTKSDTPVTLKQIQVALEMKPGIASGSLASLMSANKVVREQVSRAEGSTGRKIQWAYKPVANPQQNAVESISE
jgi:predicted transcriptional regulator